VLRFSRSSPAAHANCRSSRPWATRRPRELVPHVEIYRDGYAPAPRPPSMSSGPPRRRRTAAAARLRPGQMVIPRIIGEGHLLLVEKGRGSATAANPARVGSLDAERRSSIRAWRGEA
jgi:hypothetical protein